MSQNSTISANNMAVIANGASGPLLNPSSSTVKAKHPHQNYAWICLKTYCTSLVAVGGIVPVVASFVAVILYLTLPYSPLPPFLSLQSGSQWYTLVYSSFITGMLWLVVAIPFCYFSTAHRANPRNYSLLKSRLHQLTASLGMKGDTVAAYDKIDTFESVMKNAGIDKNDIHKWKILQEAYICCIDISEKLHKFSVGFPWMIGTGYTTTWLLLHHAEECLIEVADIETAVRGAKHDFLAIQDSQMNSKDALIDDVIEAVAVLKPEALTYFKEHQPSKSSAAFSQFTQLINKLSDQITASSPPDKKSVNNGADPDVRAKAESLAKATLREVRSTLNDYRDKRWEGFVGQRSRLLKAIAITGIVTHALLCITILTSLPPAANQPFTSTQSGIMAATMFYMIGAVAGLFVRFYYESRGGTSIDDFGLSTTRLVAIPLLSGLAGIGGVLITEMLAALGGTALLGSSSEKFIALSNLFSLDPRLLLTAAIFGVTPNLVIKGLQNQADAYATELQSSKAAGTQKAATKV